MGLFRKITSVSTMGAVDFRSAKDRTAAHTKASRKQLQRQTAIMQQQLAMQQAQAQHQQHAGAWYPDPGRAPRTLRWHDGHRWTEHTRPM